jgi:hypothetical protein
MPRAATIEHRINGLVRIVHDTLQVLFHPWVLSASFGTDFDREHHPVKHEGYFNRNARRSDYRA